MRDHVAVRMTRQPARRIERDSPEDERNALFKRVRIHAESDAHVQPSGSCRAARCSKIVTVS